MTSTFTNTRGKIKTECREIANERLDPQPYRRALTLPGAGAECVRRGFETGIFDDASEIVTFESDGETGRKMQQNMRRHLGMHTQEHTGEKRYKSYEYHPGDITRFDPSGLEADRKFDYCNLDFCGLCNANIARWLLATSRHWVRPGTRMAFTFCGVTRFQMAVNWIRSAQSMLLPRMVPQRDKDFYHDSSTGGWECMRDDDYDRKMLVPLYESVATQFALVWGSMPYRFKLLDSRVYQDRKTPMVFLHGVLSDEPVPNHARQLVAAAVSKWFSQRKHCPVIRPLGMSPQRWAMDERNHQAPDEIRNPSNLVYAY